MIQYKIIRQYNFSFLNSNCICWLRIYLYVYNLQSPPSKKYGLQSQYNLQASDMNDYYNITNNKVIEVVRHEELSEIDAVSNWFIIRTKGSS